MEYFIQQLINGITLGSIYGLIAIGYTMVYGIIGMINFAHGDIFMVGAFIALISLLAITAMGITFLPVVLMIVLIVSMLMTSVWGWGVERIAYRPLRGSFRLAPLITAIGMSIVLQNFVQVVQGARVKPLPPQITGGFTLMESDGGFAVQLSYMQILIIVTTVLLMAGFTMLINKTSLGRAQRACEQDQKMAALLGVNVDRTISTTFVMGAALASVAGVMFLLLLRRDRLLHRLPRWREGLHRSCAGWYRLFAGCHAWRPAHWSDRNLLVWLFFCRIQGRGSLLDPRDRADLPAVRPARQA